MAISLWGAQYYFGSKWKSKYTGQGRFEVRASEYPCQSSEKAEIMYAAPARYRIRGAMVNVILKSNIGQKPSWSGEVAAMYEQSRREDIAGRGNLLYTSRRFSADVMYSYGFKHTTFGLDKQSWHTMAGTYTSWI